MYTAFVVIHSLTEVKFTTLGRTYQDHDSYRFSKDFQWFYRSVLSVRTVPFSGIFWEASFVDSIVIAMCQHEVQIFF